MTFYNTNQESGDTLTKSRQNAQTQEMKVLYYFREKRCQASPERVRWDVFKDSVPLTSIRRAITNLTNDGYLVKCDDMTMGCYGKMVHTWQLSTNQLELF